MGEALLVLCHPLARSLSAQFAAHAETCLLAQGHRVTVHDLYARGFQPALSRGERSSYYLGQFAADAVGDEIAALERAEILVLVFPTWWFGFPAMLKGWFDRVWAPGHAFDHGEDFGPIRPKLTRLRRAIAITTLGTPWWVDRLVMRRPVRRVLKTALLGACAPQARLHMLSLYAAETVTPERVERFKAEIEQTVGG